MNDPATLSSKAEFPIYPVAITPKFREWETNQEQTRKGSQKDSNVLKELCKKDGGFRELENWDLVFIQTKISKLTYPTWVPGILQCFRSQQFMVEILSLSWTGAQFVGMYLRRLAAQLEDIADIGISRH